MIPLLLIVVPLVTGLISFFIKDDKTVKGWALISSVVTFAIALAGAASNDKLLFNTPWLPLLGSSFSLQLDGMAKMLTLLTGVSFPLVFAAISNNNYTRSFSFYALMLLTQAGLMGVFLSADVLLFYFFWELALIPAYFLCSQWGGEKRIQVTFKFFIYTFIGSLLMLVGILYLYYKTPEHSFALKDFYALKLSAKEQAFAFWLFFVAFAIKMPIFPFHTWQPDTYEQSPTAVTMILSGVMVKMGLYAVIRWILPVFPSAVEQFGHVVILLSVIGMLYASLIAIRQNDIKRMIAYSSIAHIGLMSAAIFANQQVGLQGVMVQMFNHGINVIGLWIVTDAIEQQLGTRKFSELGGLAQRAPGLAILFVVMALANVALPLTNAFIGEFLMFNGLFKYNIWMAVIALISIILAAVYTLNAVQKIFYGDTNHLTEKASDSGANVKLALAVITLMIIVLGFYPEPILRLTNDTVQAVLAQIK
jgi:NADH-quinone oxidoreductase subunit M